MKKVVVIGAGPAGYVCAIRLAQYGLDVTVVEKEQLGGTCLNVGCIPSKALIAAGALLERVARASAMGITGELSLDVKKLVAWKQGIVGKLTGGVAALLEKHGAKVLRGNASFRDPRTVVVQGGGGQHVLEADEFVIATGSAPTSIPGFAFDGEHVWSSTEALSPDSVPGRLLVIGGGYIGLELGMLYRNLGSEVTVVEFTDGALPGQDRDCVKVIERSIKKQKIRFLTRTSAKGFEASGGTYRVQVEPREGAAGSVQGNVLECDRILCTVGRRPYTDGLGLENAGLSTDARGFLAVDERLRTRVPHIFAVGDVAGQPMLAHKGSKEGLIAAAVIAGKQEVVDYRCVPAVIFTAPEMASVGLLEEDARARGHELSIGQFRFAASGRAMSLLETEGFVKVIADAHTDEVLGVHMVGPEVTELIAEAALAIELGATSEDIARTIHAHPTLPEALMEAAEDVHGMAVHLYNPRT